MRRLILVCNTAAFLILLLARASSAVDEAALLDTFVLHPDFEIGLAAAEPLVFDPVDMEFDAAGRAFVLEMPGYPFPEVPGRVVLLEDTNGDYAFDTRTVFADGFPVACSLLPYRDGLLVASPPDLLYLRDTDADNIADTREVLLSGFAVENTQHNVSGLTHGLDNWIYLANGGNGGRVFFPDTPDETINMRGFDLRVHLEEKRIDVFGRSTGGFECSFDDWGRFFGTHNLRPMSQIVFPHRYIGGLPVSSTLVEIPDYTEDGLVRIHPIGVQESRVNHDEQAGFFSASCGITYYGGGVFPMGFENNLFVCDAVLNLVHRAKLSEDGAAYKASRVRERVEFLASTDRGFRPVNLAVAPDGAMYVLDMHRTVIEHPEWIPDEIEVTLDIDEGKTQGRIYRIAPKAGLPRVTPNFPREDIAAVVAQLAHSNKWWRDTAQRLLVEWNDTAAIAPLRYLLRDATDPRARLHALWCLEGLDAVDAEDLRAALRDAHPAVREDAIRIAETHAEGMTLAEEIATLAKDPAPRVRIQCMLSLDAMEEVPYSVVGNAARNVAIAGLDDPWIRLALLCAARQNPLDQLGLVVGDVRLADQSGAGAYLHDVATLLGQNEAAENVALALEILGPARIARADLVEDILDGLAEGFERRRNAPEIESAAKLLDPFFSEDRAGLVRAAWRVSAALDLPATEAQRVLLARAADTVRDASAPLDARREQLALLAFAPFADREDTLFALLDSGQPSALRRAAIGQIGDAGHPAVARRLVRQWKSLPPDVIRPASDVLLNRSANYDILLTALEEKAIPIGQMNFDLERRRRLLFSNNVEIQERAKALFTDAGVVTRRAAIDAMRPALALEGNPASGREVFTELCAQCHQVGGEGASLGPNLTDIFRKSPETLLNDIADPNAAVDPAFVSFTIETTGGEYVTGILAKESEESVTLIQAMDMETVIRRDEIVEMRSTGLSIMPEGLETDMPHQLMADLLAFLVTPR